MSDVTLRQLEYFLATVNTQSLTKAAETCRVSQAAISLAIDKLESSLGLQLIIRRRGKGVAASSAGEVVAMKARALLSDAGDLTTTAQELQGTLTGELHIGCFSTLSPEILPPLLDFFTRQHADLQINLTEGTSSHIQELMLAGQIDACLLFSKHLHPEAQAIELAEVVPKVLLPKDHPLAKKKTLSLYDLHDEPAIVVDHAPGLGIFEELLQSTSFKPNIRWRSKYVETIRRLVHRGLGYSVVFYPRSYIDENVTVRPLADDFPYNALVIALPPTQRVSLKMHTLIERCRQEFMSDRSVPAHQK